MFANAVLHIQNINARREHKPIVSALVGGDLGDLLFPILAQHHERVFGVNFCRKRWHAPIGKIDRFRRNDMQLSLQDTRRYSLSRLGVAQQIQEKAANQQAFHKQHRSTANSRAG